MWRFDKSDGNCEQSSLEKATVKFYAFSFREPDGNWNHQVEQILSQIESKSIPLLQQVQRGRELTMSQKADVALLIATLIRRPAALLDLFKAEMERLVGNRRHQHSLVDSLLPQLRGRFSEAEIEHARKKIDEGYFDRSVDEAKAHHMQVWLSTWPKYVECLTRMHWQIVKSAEGFFVTSDAPAFVRRHAHDEDPVYIGLGQTDLDIELIFPISNSHLLIARSKPIKAKVKAPKTRVQELNARIMRMSHRYVFSKSCSPELQRLFDNNRHFKAPLPDFTETRSTVAKKYGIAPEVL